MDDVRNVREFIMTLWQQYLHKKETAGKLYFPREGAVDLGVSEGALLATAPNTVYLGTNMRAIILKLATLGKVECVVRNQLAVHEKIGVYENVSLAATSGLALNIGGLDLRFFLKRWHHALAVCLEHGNELVRSIQFFDEFGVCIQKVFLRDETKLAQWQALVDEFSVAKMPEFIHTPMPAVAEVGALSLERELAFQERWLELKDVHHFTGLLETFDLDRQQSYRHAPKGMAKQVDNGIWEKVFNQVKDNGMELMIFVGNRGVVQIQTGKVHHVVRSHGYLNILDRAEENFTLHLKDDEIVETWVVRRPIRDGVVTCIEGFDARRKSSIILFGRRQEGEIELPEWENITSELLQ